MYWNWMSKKDAAFFYNGGRMGQWSRKALIDDYARFVPMIRNMYQIISGFIIFKKGALPIVNEWFDKMKNHSEYVIDVDNSMKIYEYPEFIESRHDQAVLSAAAFKHYFDTNILVTRQRSERLRRGGQALFNARISDNMMRNPMIYEPIHILIIRTILVVPFRKLMMSIYMMKNKMRFVYNPR